MCGITGFVDRRGALQSPLLRLEEMVASLHHRGPDAHGVWFDEKYRIGLAHARLSIIDLSAEGAQPMVSASGRTVVSYNGEIYNFKELRRDLERNGVRFRSRCDTEVLVEGIEKYGVEAMVERLVGMFAFAAWDSRAGILNLVRDRFGIKPLYLAVGNDTIVFGSELKAIMASTLMPREINRSALKSYLQFGYVPTPLSILQGVGKVEPGTITRIQLTENSFKAEVIPYWDSQKVAEDGLANPLDGDAHAITDQVEDVLRQAISDRLVSDVPLGAFLSGGIDSSLVVALMQESTSKPVRTFTIGFEEHGYNEAPAAKRISEHIGTDHTELTVTAAEAMAVIPELASMYDEPFADSSQIPTFAVSRLARQHVTVSLSGDGGDELFAGYNRYLHGYRVWKKLSRLPAPLRRRLPDFLRMCSVSTWDRLYALPRALAPGLVPPQHFGYRVHKLAGVLDHDDDSELYRALVSQWESPDELINEVSTPIRFDGVRQPEGGSFIEYMMLADTQSYLTDDILTKVDRASMAVSLEARVPLLDHRVFEIAWQLPSSFKYEDGVGKRILRSILERRVPRTLYERPKIGFGIPLHEWLRGPLREWSESLLTVEKLEQLGLNAPFIRSEWDRHIEGKANRQSSIWTILMLQSWVERWL